MEDSVKHRTRKTLVAISLVLALMLVGCTAAAPEPDAGNPGDAAGIRLAAGLYDQEDGTVLAIGTLEWRDIEGGFWAVIGGTEAEGTAGDVAAVLAGIEKDDATYTALAGKTVEVKGTRNEGASIRMAGPEITVTAITEISDTPGIAE
jgi:hypothetical protein